MSTVLVIDDMAICREPLAEALRFHGYQTVCAEDGPDALSALHRHDVDLILLDLGLPTLDGFSVLQTVRNSPEFKDLPVIVLTESAQRDAVVQAAKYGVQGYILKSRFSLDRLLKRIRECLDETPKTNKENGETPKEHSADEEANRQDRSARSEDRKKARKPEGQKESGLRDSSPVSDFQTPTSIPHSPALRLSHVALRSSDRTEGRRSRRIQSGAALETGAALAELKPLLSAEDLRNMIHEGLMLRPLGPAVQNVMAVTADRWCGAEDVARAVAGDQALSIRILKLANSTTYSRGRTVHTIKEAVQRIGVSEVRNMVMTLGVLDQFNGETYSTVCPSLDSARFWEHSTACGSAAVAVAAATKIGRRDEMFLLGMIHDVGRLILIERLATKYCTVLETAERLDLPLEVVEPRMLGADHCEVARQALMNWSFPREFVAAAVSHHHSPAKIQRLEPGVRDAAAVVALADRIAHAMLLGSSGNECIYPLDDFVSALSLTPDLMADIAEQVEHGTREMKLMIAASGTQTGWSSLAYTLRRRLPTGLRPLCVDVEPATNAYRMACERIAAATEETPVEAIDGSDLRTLAEPNVDPAPAEDKPPPNVAVMYLRNPAEQPKLLENLVAKEREAGMESESHGATNGLPLLIICNKGNPDRSDAALQSRPHVVLKTPVLHSRLVDALGRLLGEPLAAEVG